MGTVTMPGEEITPPSEQEQKRRSADKFRGRMETAAWFFNKVLLGSALAIFLAYLLFQIFTGKVQIKVPSGSEVTVTTPANGVAALGGDRAEEMFKELTTTHSQQLEVMRQSLEVSKLAVKVAEQQATMMVRQTQVLNEISCRLYRSDAEQIRCLKRALRQGLEQ